MAKCSVCGKKGLFLQVDQNGRCKNCAWLEGYRAKQLAGEVPLANASYTFARNSSANKIVTKQTAKTQTIESMLQFSDIPYSFVDVPVMYGQLDRGILLVGSNREQAQRDIDAMDVLLADAYTRVPKLPQLHIGDVRWIPECDEYGDYTRLFCDPFTKTGRISKHPLRLLFETRRECWGDGIDGELFYSAEGTIGRVKINIHKANKYFSLVYTLNKGEFCLDYAFTRDENSNDVNLYKRP